MSFGTIAVRNLKIVYLAIIFSVIYFTVREQSIHRVHSQPGNRSFFTEKSVYYQGILVEYQENKGKLTFSWKNIFQW